MSPYEHALAELRWPVTVVRRETTLGVQWWPRSGGCDPYLSPDYDESWLEVLDDYVRQNSIKRTLRPLFAFKLIASEEIENAFRHSPVEDWTRFWNEIDRNGYAEVSAVGFDNGKTRAIVYAALHCGGTCGNPTTRAECIQAGRWWLDDSWAELVFSGTVDEIVRTAPLGFRASVTVERAWKGAVDKRFDLFVWETAGERPPISLGQRYVFALRRMRPTDDQRERDGAGVPDDSVAFTPILCGAEPYADAERSGLVRDFGPGYAPK